MSKQINATFTKINIGGIINSSSILNVNGDVSIDVNNQVNIGDGGIRSNNGMIEYRNPSENNWQPIQNPYSGYLNFSGSGESGYGIRDNAGIIEFKNNNGSWAQAVGSGSISNSGQLLYLNVSNWTGGTEMNVNLTTSLTDYGKLNIDIYEIIPSATNYITSSWEINANDASFTMYNFYNNRGDVTISGTSGIITLTLITPDTWTNDDLYKEFNGNNGTAIITSLISSTIANATVTKQFTNTNTITSWALYAGKFDTDGSFKMVPSSFKTTYRMDVNQILGFYLYANCQIPNYFSVNSWIGYISPELSTGYTNSGILMRGTSSAAMYIGNSIQGISAWGGNSYNYSQQNVYFFRPQICFDNISNTTFIYTLLLSYRYINQNNSLPTGFIIGDALFAIRDNQVSKMRPTNIHPFMNGPGTCYYPFSYNPSIIANSGKIFIMANKHNTNATTWTANLGKAYSCGFLQVYTNKMTIDTTYGTNFARKLFSAKLGTGTNSQYYQLLYTKIFIGGNNTLWVCGIGLEDSDIDKFLYCMSSDNGITWTTALGTTVGDSVYEVFLSQRLNPNAGGFKHAYYYPNYNRSLHNGIAGTIQVKTTSQAASFMYQAGVYTAATEATQDSLNMGQTAYCTQAPSEHNFYFFPVNTTDTWAVFSSSTTANAKFQIYFAKFANSLITIDTSSTYCISNEADYTGYDQFSPIGINDNNNRVIFVWNGTTTANGNGTYYNIYDIITSSFSGSVFLTSGYPPLTAYYNLLKKRSGTIYLTFSGGSGKIYEYILPNNSNTFISRIQPDDNYKLQLVNRKWSQYNIHSTLNTCLAGDKIIGIGMFNSIDMMNIGDYSHQVSRQNNYGLIVGGTAVEMIPAWPYYFTENTTAYEWNPNRRIHMNISSGLNTDQVKPIIKSYNNVLYNTWQGFTSNSVNKIYFQYSTNSGQTWSSPVRVSNLDLYSSEIDPDMYVDNNGKIHIVFSAYSQYDTTNYQIYYSNSNNYTSIFNSSVNISLNKGYNQLYSKITGNDNNVNKLFIAWQGDTSAYFNNTKQIYIAKNEDNGVSSTWTYSINAPVTSGTFLNYNNYYPSIYYRNSTLHLSWIGHNVNTIYDSLFYANSTNEGSTFNISETNYILPINTTNVLYQVMSVDQGNVIHIVLCQSLTNNAVYAVNSTDNGSTWSIPNKLDNNLSTITSLTSYKYRELEIFSSIDGKTYIFFKDFIMSESYPSTQYTSDVKNFMFVIYENGYYNAPEVLATTPLKLYMNSDMPAIKSVHGWTSANHTNTRGFGMDDICISVTSMNGNLYALMDCIYAGMFETSANNRRCLCLYDYTPYHIQIGKTDEQYLSYNYELVNGAITSGYGYTYVHYRCSPPILLQNDTLYGVTTSALTSTTTAGILGLQSTDFGLTFTNRAIALSGASSTNPIYYRPFIIQISNGKLYCFYNGITSADPTYMRVHYAISSDNGTTWGSTVKAETNAETKYYVIYSITTDTSNNIYVLFLKSTASNLGTGMYANGDVFCVGKLVDGSATFASSTPVSTGTFTGGYSCGKIMYNPDNSKLYVMYSGTSVAYTTNKQIFVTSSSNSTTWSTPELVSNHSTILPASIGSFDFFIFNNNLHVVGSTVEITTTILNSKLFYTYKSSSGSSNDWTTNMIVDITPDLACGNKIDALTYTGDFMPSIYIRNNILYITCYGTIWNNMFGNKPVGVKLYTKNLSQTFSNFTPNKYMISRPGITFNTTYLSSYNISIYVDKNSVIHIFAILVNASSQPKTYYYRSLDQSNVITNTKVSALTNSSGNISALYWNQIINSILNENTNGAEAYYSLCYDDANYQTWYIFSALEYRKIIIYDKITETFTINTDAVFANETFTSPVSTNLPTDFDQLTLRILEEAIDTITNRMTGTMFNAATSFPIMNDILNIRFAIILRSASSTINPQTNSMKIKYGANAQYQRKTDLYTIKIRNLSSLSITPPNDGNTRNAILYLTNGSSAAIDVPQSNFAQFETTQAITQQTNTTYSILDTSNGVLMKKISGTVGFIIDGNNISINATGTYYIDILFDINVDIFTYNKLEFSIDGLKTLSSKITNGNSMVDRIYLKTLMTVSNAPHTFGLYIKSTNICNMVCENVMIIIKKLA